MNMIDNKGRKLVPLRIDRNTVLLVPPEKATPERAKNSLNGTTRKNICLNFTTMYW